MPFPTVIPEEQQEATQDQQLADSTKQAALTVANDYLAKQAQQSVAAQYQLDHPSSPDTLQPPSDESQPSLADQLKESTRQAAQSAMETFTAAKATAQQTAQDVGQKAAGAVQDVSSATQSAPENAHVAMDNSSPSNFLESLRPAAEYIQEKYGIPAKAMLAIAANETGYGKYVAGNNLFGIKGTGPAGSINSPTWEVVNGQKVNINDNFRGYDNPLQAFEDFAQLVTSAPRYAAAKGLQDAGQFAQALLRGGYATDPDWAQKIANIAATISGKSAPIAGSVPAAGASATAPSAVREATSQPSPSSALPYNDMAGARSDYPSSMASYMPGLSPTLTKPTESFAAPTQNGLLPGSLADLDEQIRQAEIQSGTIYRPPAHGQPFDPGKELLNFLETEARRSRPGFSPTGLTMINPNLVPPTANEAFEQGTEALGHLPAGGFLKDIVGFPGQAANIAAGAVSPQQPGESNEDYGARIAASLERGAAAGAVGAGVGHAFGDEGAAPEEAAKGAESLWQNIRKLANQVGLSPAELKARDTFIQQGLASFDWIHGEGTPEAAAATKELYQTATKLTAQDVLDHIDNALYEATAAKEGRAQSVDPEIKIAYQQLWKPNPGAQGGGEFRDDITEKQWAKWGYPPVGTTEPNARGVRYVLPKDAADWVANNHVTGSDGNGISIWDLRDKMLQYERDLKAGSSESGNVQTLKEQRANVEAILQQVGGEAPNAAASANGAAIGGANGSANGGGGTTTGAPSAGSGSGAGGRLPFEQAAPQFLAQSRGTAEEQAQIAGKIARDPEREKQVLLGAFPESIRPYLQDIAGEYGENFAGRRRGVITDVQAAQNAIAAASGMSVPDLMKTKAGTAFNQEQILALGNTVTMLGEKVRDLAENKQSYSAAGRWTAAMEADRVKAALQLGVTASLFRGSQAEAGRALRAFQAALNGEQSISMRAIARATERFGIGSKDFAPQTEPGSAPGVGGQRQPPPEGFRGTAEVQIPPGESATQLPHQENLPGTFPPHPEPTAPPEEWNRWQAALQEKIPGFDVPPRPSSTATPEDWSRWETSYQEKLAGFNPPGSTATEPAVPNEAERARQRAEQAQQGAAPLGQQAGMSAQVTQKRLDNAYKAIRTNAQKFADWVSAWQQTAPDDYVGRYKLLQALGKPDLLNMAAAIRMSNLLANTKTGILIGTHGLIMAMNRPFIRFVRESPSEGMTDFLAQSKAIGVAFGNAVDAFTEGIGPAKAGEMLQRGAIDVPPEVFPGKLGMVLTPGTRFSAGVHELQQTLSTAGAEATIARRIAKASGRTVEDVIANPPPDMIKQMQDYADKYSTIDPITQWFLKGKGLMNSEVPAERAFGALINFFLPFVKYPGFVISNGAKITAAPVYYPAMAARHALLGEGEKAIGDLRMGMFASTVLGIIIAEAAAGNVTGSGPQNAEQRAALEQARDPKTGQPIWQANSVRIPTPGGYRWVDNKLMGILTVPLSVVGAAAEAYRFGEVKDQPTEKVVSNVAGSVLKSMLDASYLKQVAQIITSMQQGQGTGVASATVTGLGGFVPYSSALAEVNRVTSPEAKAPAGVAQEIASRIPVLSSTVPNRITPYGQEARNPQDVVSMAVPATTSVAGPVNPVANEVARLQAAGESVAPKVFTAAEQSGGGAYLGSPQSGEQIRNLQQAMGTNAQRYLENAINDPKYAVLSDKQKAAALRDALAVGNKQAETKVGEQQSVVLNDAHKAALAWEQVPHYEGVKGSPEQIAEQNFEVAQAKAKLAEYKKLNPNDPEKAAYQFMKADKQAWVLAQRAPLDRDYLDVKRKRIDTQYHGALIRQLSPDLVELSNVVLPAQ